MDAGIDRGILFTDQYQLTMAQLYFRFGLHEREAHFDHFFRTYPNYGSHRAGYCVYAGLAWVLDWMQRARFTERELSFLRGQRNLKGNRVFGDDFLSWLSENGSFDGVRVLSVPEGRVVHPHEPLTVVKGPLAMTQILETSLLNHLNYQTLIATKASRIKQTCGKALVLEFGARRAHDLAANAGTRAALIGGVDFSSNVGISHLMGIDPKGTHAHSMVQAFIALGEGELSAFRAYAEVYPDDCLLLVDTINTLESGVPNAIAVFEELRRKGHKPVGIRLDSGDLATLSMGAAKMLNDAGFSDTSIVLSNQLDEIGIMRIKEQIENNAGGYGVDADELIDRLVYGIGTKLITSSGDPALDGVYKLAAVRDGLNRWLPATKVSETAEKVVIPGNKHVWRMYDRNNMAIGDIIALADERPDTDKTMRLHHPESGRGMVFDSIEPLLVPVKEQSTGALDPAYITPRLDEMRKRCAEDLARLSPGVKKICAPEGYQVFLSSKLWKMKQEMTHSFGDESKKV